VVAAIHLDDGLHPRTNCCAGPGIAGDGYWSLAFEENGAAALEWYRERHAPDLDVARLADLAGDVPPGSDGLAARRQPQRYEGLTGFSRCPGNTGYGHGHHARAIMESVATSLAGLIHDLSGDRVPERVVATGGGARSAVWLQIMADVAGTEFVTSACPEPACRGAAMLASVAAGWFQDAGAAASEWISMEKVFRPDGETHRAYAEMNTQYGSATR
jgi:xylulokinase